MNGVTEGQAMCPFFRAEARKGRLGIICEGFYGVQTVKLCFRNSRRMQEYKEDFCNCMSYKACPIAQLVEEKYESEKTEG